jgi:hypothetical protein
MVYLRHSGLRTMRGGIRFGLDLWRFALPKHRLLGYQRIAISCGLSVNLPVFAVPNIVKSSLAYLLFPAMYGIGQNRRSLNLLNLPDYRTLKATATGLE